MIKTLYQCILLLVINIIQNNNLPMLNIYNGFIFPSLNPATCHNLEIVQHRVARFVTGDFHRTSSVSEMLQHLQCPTLQERRATNKVAMMFRIVNNLVAIPTTCLVPTVATVRGHTHRFLVPIARTVTYQHSFFLDTIRLWNNLPASIVACNSISTFKSELQNIKFR